MLFCPPPEQKIEAAAEGVLAFRYGGALRHARSRESEPRGSGPEGTRGVCTARHPIRASRIVSCRERALWRFLMTRMISGLCALSFALLLGTASARAEHSPWEDQWDSR